MKAGTKNKILMYVGVGMVMMLPLLTMESLWGIANKPDTYPSDVVMMILIGAIIVSLCGWLVLAKVHEGEKNGMVKETEKKE